MGMSALGSLLIGEEFDAAAAAPETIAEQFPLNLRARALLSSDYEGDGSDRVRLRRVFVELGEAGFRVSGAEPSQFCDSAQVSWSARFNRQGDLKSGVQVALCDGLSDGDLESMQAAFQAQGFAALVTESRQMKIVAFDPGDGELLDWLELGMDRQLHDVPLEEARVWIRRDPAFASSLLRKWFLSGLGLEVACAWVEASRSLKSSGLDLPDISADWIAAGVSPSEACAWVEIDLSLRNFSAAEPWRNRFSLEQAALWVPACLNGWRPSFDRALELEAAGLDAGMLERLVELGFKPERFSLFTQLLLRGYSKQQILAWAELGPRFFSIEQLRHWIDSGIEPQRARGWLKLLEDSGSYGHALLSRIAWIAEWDAAGLSASDAEPWIACRECFWDYGRVRDLQAAGYSLQSLAGWVEVCNRVYGSHSSPGFLSADGIAQWTQMGSPFDQPQAVERMLMQGLSVEQVKLVASEISAA